MLTKIQEDIIVQCMPLAKRIAANFHCKYKKRYDYDELLSEAYKLLVEEVPKYDASKGANMLTYLYNSMTWGLLRYVRDDKWFLASGRSERSKSTNSPFLSLEDYMKFDDGDSEKYCPSKVIEDTSLLDPLVSAMYKQIFELLPKDLREILYLKYEKGFTQLQIADLFNTSQATISKREKRAYRIVREKWKIAL